MENALDVVGNVEYQINVDSDSLSDYEILEGVRAQYRARQPICIASMAMDLCLTMVNVKSPQEEVYSEV